ncbi:GNAT family N-acetyltransferase [Arthrobacter sp. Alg241-R88]|jgi:Acetyltransferase (GNAT) domain|uniref:GNAT family N-acetyltransferase n=1 Tax=Arthrobacter sp. Alg241-R88 TaxID=2305984 RepID=UPI0013D647F1|nr:GNAT family N-acetyltransferase [Arthrobacter sp. Alg241-R88]
MDFFASEPFLTSLAKEFHHAKDFLIKTYEIDGRIVRLAEINGRRTILTGPFYDYVKPLPSNHGATHGALKFIPSVVTSTIPLAGPKPNGYQLGTGQDPAPLIVWSGFSTWEAYEELLKERDKGLLRVMRRRRAKLLSEHGVPAYLFDDRNIEALEMLFTWKREQYEGGHETLQDPRALAMLRHLFEDGHLVVSSLKIRDQYVAVQAGFLWRGDYLALIPAYDPAFAKYGVGKELLLRMLEDSYRKGHKSFDLLQGAEPYKFDFATHLQIIESLGTPPLAYWVRSRAQAAAKAALVRVSPRLFYGVKRAVLAARRLRTSMKAEKS